MRGALRLAASLALLAATGAAAEAPLDLWPLVVRDARPIAGLRTTRVGGPFFEAWEAEDARGFTLRPFLARLESEAGDRLEFLYPLGQLRRDSDRTQLRLTPLLDHAWHTRPEDAEAEVGSRWSFLLAFGGRTREGGSYAGVFPLGGVAKQRFGLERLEFWLFPLFARSRDASGYTRTHVLWPFFAFGSGGGRRSLRVWPFYGHDVREGEFERRFALWPLIHWRIERPGDPLERRVRLFLPFYGESRRGQARARFILGPVYLRAENDLTGAVATDVAWPLFRYARRPPSEEFAGSREIRIEPFFRRGYAPGVVSTGTLFGAVRRSFGRTDRTEFESFRLLFVSRFDRERDLESGAERSRRQLWPLFRRVESCSASGGCEGHLAAPWLLPLVGQGWLRHGLGLVTGFERRWRGGEARSDWLFGLARSRSAPDYRLDAISWLVRREWTPQRRHLRVLGIPFDSEPRHAAPEPLPTLSEHQPD